MTTRGCGGSSSSTARLRSTNGSASAGTTIAASPGSSLYGITTKFSEGRHFELARFQALAAEAVLRGLGDKPAEEPPPLYAFDPQIGRLTVTTPSYNTAITAVSNGAFPYGGIELARLYDSRQRVVSHIGGRAPAAMGIVVSGPRGIVASSQRPRTVLRPGRRPITLTRSPRGPVRKGARYPRLTLRGSLYGAGDRRVLSAGGRRVPFALPVHDRPDRRLVADQPFAHRRAFGGGALPELGRSDDQRPQEDGRAREADGDVPGAAASTSPAVDYFFIDGSEGGYVVLPRTFSLSPQVGVINPRKQASNPRPGPSLSIRLARASRWAHLSLDVSIALARDPAEAAAAAARLRAS